MDPRVERLTTTEQCDNFERNADHLGEVDLARQARIRRLEIRASAYSATTQVEKDCLRAVYAYEETLRRKNGKNSRASRTWQMIKRHGILPAVERAVDREQETAGYRSLVEMGLEEFAFEAVILRNPTYFSPEVVARSATRLDELRRG